jgi:transcriptional regulator with XRE-family HTH domain
MPIDRKEIRRRREYLNLSHGQAGQRAGFGEGQKAASRWNDVESGRYQTVTIPTLEAVARALACRVQDLLTSDEQPRSSPAKAPKAAE